MFYFLADFGHFNERNHELLTNISILLERELPKFVLFGGDNFYPSGIIESNKKYYENEFKIYFHKKLYNIYGVLGNHDYMGNIKYQIQNPRFCKLKTIFKPNILAKLNSFHKTRIKSQLY